MNTNLSVCANCNQYKKDCVCSAEYASGMTKRELFAAKAMQGILATDGTIPSREKFAVLCVKLADAVIATTDHILLMQGTCLTFKWYSYS